MARIDGNTEEKISASRARKRQDKECPLLVRDDGVLVPNVPLIRRKPNFRPYRGPLKPAPTRQQLIDYYNSVGVQQRRAVVGYNPSDAFDLGKADADDIVNFAMEEFGIALDPDAPLQELRRQCYNLSIGKPAEPAAPPDPQPPMAAGMGMSDGFEEVPGVGDITAPPRPAATSQRRRRTPTEG